MKQFTPHLIRPIVLTALLAPIWPLTPLSTAAATGPAIPISQVVNPGLLELEPSASASLSAITLNHRQGNASTGSLSPATVDDSRGSLSGWNLTATFSNLSSNSGFTDPLGQPGPFTVTGTYAGTTDLELDLMTQESATGSGLNQMIYTLKDTAGNKYTRNNVETLTASQPIGDTGLSFTAADISYPTWTTYHLKISVVPASGFTVSPTALTTLAGRPDGVTGGSARPLGGPTDPATVMSAAVGAGEGLYQAGLGLTLNVPAGTRAGSYTGQVVETLN